MRRWGLASVDFAPSRRNFEIKEQAMMLAQRLGVPNDRRETVCGKTCVVSVQTPIFAPQKKQRYGPLNVHVSVLFNNRNGPVIVLSNETVVPRVKEGLHLGAQL